MTLIEALAEARKFTPHRKVRHPSWGTAWLEIEKLAEHPLSFDQATSCEWQVEPRQISMKEPAFREAALPVLCRYLERAKADACLSDLQHVIFKQ